MVFSLFKKQKKDIIQLIREYERLIFCNRQELVPLRYHFNLAQERIRVLDLGNIKHGQELDTLKLECNQKLDQLKIENDEKVKALEIKYSAEISDIKNKDEQREKSLKEKFRRKLEGNAEEKENLKEINIALRDRERFLEAEICSYDKQIHHLINESLFYQAEVQKIKEEYEKSTCWRMTKPIRWIGRLFRKF